MRASGDGFPPCMQSEIVQHTLRRERPENDLSKSCIKSLQAITILILIKVCTMRYRFIPPGSLMLINPVPCVVACVAHSWNPIGSPWMRRHEASELLAVTEYSLRTLEWIGHCAVALMDHAVVASILNAMYGDEWNGRKSIPAAWWRTKSSVQRYIHILRLFPRRSRSTYAIDAARVGSNVYICHVKFIRTIRRVNEGERQRKLAKNHPGCCSLSR